MSRRGTTIVVAGFINQITIDSRTFLKKWLTIKGIVGARWPIGASQPENQNLMALGLHLIAQKKIDARPLISEVMPLKDIQKILDISYEGKQTAILIKP